MAAESDTPMPGEVRLAMDSKDDPPPTRKRERTLSREEKAFLNIQNRVRRFFAENVPWRSRVITLALIVGLLCGVIEIS